MAGFRVVFRNSRSAWLFSIWVSVIACCYCPDLVWALEEVAADEFRGGAASIEYTGVSSEPGNQKESSGDTNGMWCSL